MRRPSRASAGGRSSRGGRAPGWWPARRWRPCDKAPRSAFHPRAAAPAPRSYLAPGSAYEQQREEGADQNQHERDGGAIPQLVKYERLLVDVDWKRRRLDPRTALCHGVDEGELGEVEDRHEQEVGDDRRPEQREDHRSVPSPHRRALDLCRLQYLCRQVAQAG